ncbi:MAG: type secretion system protein GspF, partial [Pseudomonadota bacterium]
MPAYSYEALDLEGKTRRGTLEADTAKSARGQLRGQKLVPLQVEVLGQAATSDTGNAPRSSALWTRRAFNANQLAIWT